MSSGTDYTLEDSVYLLFTTRAFATGIPGTLSASTVSVYEDVTATPVLDDVAVTESLNSVAGLNAVTIAATAANGFNVGGAYHVVIKTGTVDSVSVVGEVVGHFTIGHSAAAVDLANGTDGLGAIKAETALIVADTNELQTDDIPGTLALIPQSGGTTSWNATALAAINAEADTALSDYDPPTNTEMLAATAVTDALIVALNDPTAATIADAVWDEAATGHTDAGKAGQQLWTDIDAILVDTGTTLDGKIDTIGTDTAATQVLAAGATGFAAIDTVVDAILVDTGEIGAAGAGLTNINLPNQTMDITGDITGNLSGSVGSVTGHTAQTGDSFAIVNGAAGLVAIDTVVDAIKVITDALGATAAANLALSAAGIIGGTAATGTLSTTQCTSDLTGYVNDELIGRTIIFTGGTADGQASDITDYASASGLVTFTAITTAPVNNDTFVIV